VSRPPHKFFTVRGKLGLEQKRQEDILPIYTMQRIERRPPTDDHPLLRAVQATLFRQRFRGGATDTKLAGTGLRWPPEIVSVIAP
jgi:hypothetical protein